MQVVERLSELKPIYVDGKKVDAPWKMTEARHARAIAMYLHVKKENIAACTNCSNEHKSRGPGNECVAGDASLYGGACSNCYYSGLGHRCSFRLGKFSLHHLRGIKLTSVANDEKKQDALAKEEPKFTGFTKSMLEKATR